MRLLDVLVDKKSYPIPPMWMMRQAGRYLPEYKKVRQEHPDFMEFCFSGNDVVEVTLQPVRRFPIDAAIIFSDILVIPHVLGQRVWFEPDHGPKLENVDLGVFLRKAEAVSLTHALAPVADAIAKTRALLAPEKALIGFAGAPWTLLTYMISQGKTADFSTVLAFAESNPILFHDLQTLLEEKVAALLCLHIEAGCDVVQIFESWAIAVPPHLRETYLYAPLKRIVGYVRLKHPHTPIIYYGRGVSDDYPALAALDIAFGVDETADMRALRSRMPHAVLQGNLAPELLLKGAKDPAFETAIQSMLSANQGSPYIFNLGHGINKDTPISHVEQMIDAVQRFSSDGDVAACLHA